MNKLQTITLKSADYSCKILPNYGAALQSYTLNNHEFVHGYISEEEVLVQKYKGVLLAPFPNRLAQAKYTFLGKEYSLPINREKEGLALHGFLYDKVFEVESSNESQVKLSYLYDNELEGYPFIFKLTVTYALHNDGTLHISTHVKNMGNDTLPFGIGWHPYFTMNQPIDTMQLYADAMQQVVLDEKKYPPVSV